MGISIPWRNMDDGNLVFHASRLVGAAVFLPGILTRDSGVSF